MRAFHVILLVASGFLLVAPTANAAEGKFAPQVWINPGVYSYHFDRNANFRNGNIGFGAEVVFARDHAAMAGTFINSDDARTRYAAYLWRPLHWKLGGADVGAGVAVGAFDGYPRYRNGGWFVAPMPVLSVELGRFGANFSVIPTLKDRVHGAVAVQVKLRVW